MRIIFHIGMGKTGTTSIQRALAENSEALAAQNAHYLGMWFDAANPKFHGLAGFGSFMAQSPSDLELCASRFVKHAEGIQSETGADTFLFSNESMFQNGERLEPFFLALQKLGVQLEFVAFLRDPRTWLPSAHTQWALRHKTNKGRVQSFDVSARRLINFYNGITFWLDRFPEETRVREATVDDDVVEDFATCVGLRLEPVEGRALERSEPADTLIRAMFNNRVHEHVLPDRFNRMVRNTDAKAVPSAEQLARVCFDFSGVDEVIAEHAETFTLIRDRAGIDFIGRETPTTAPPDEAALQRRVIDYLIDISFDQAMRIKRLERIVDDLLKE